ncbi:DNA helicase PcrA [Granulicatella elegans]|uniref:DNA helicase PcrA n=1 Tax=Granulicatella elegans TaxID=137732 RepID=UPI001D13CB01|nr:DNA helicase PcrA [Granulicatella elegans]UEA31734.1 DNA helicase PcrA [Granulicatella elegans]
MSISAKLLEGMNERQKEAVQHTQGPLLIMAGAGSGKTRVLTHRMAYILAEEEVHPWNILAITFTNKAAREMKERVSQLVGSQAEEMWVSTFHSMCVRILRRDIELLGFQRSFTICDPSEQQTAMKRILKKLDIDNEKYDYRMILNRISQAKNDLEDVEEFNKKYTGYVEQIIGKCYREYQKELAKSMTLDFDDLIMLTVQLFQKHPKTLQYYQQKFQYIHVDEYQDTNHAQYRLVTMLAKKFKNICVVGDADQSIYGWRGADMSNILEFEKDYQQAKVVLLEQNYRSTKTILQAANHVIENNVNRKVKKLWTENEEGELITYYRAQSEQDEGYYVLSQIQSLLRDGYHYDDFAILYRTNAQSRVMEENLLKSNIPFRLVGGQRFYDRLEIKDLLAYLRLIVNPQDDLSFRRIVNSPKRGIGATSLAKLSDFAEVYQLSLLEASEQISVSPLSGKAAKALEKFATTIEELRKMQEFLSISEFVEQVIEKTGYLASLEKQHTMEADARIENIQEFISVAKQFEQERLEEESEDSPLLQFLTDLSLVSDADSDEGDGRVVTLMTLHAAKGLEFPVVFMIGLEEGIFPSFRSIMEHDDVEEERRLAYVGITRAEQKLFLTNAYSRLLYGRTQTNRPSRFILEIGEELFDSNQQKSYGSTSRESASFVSKTSSSGSLFDKYRSKSQVTAYQSKAVQPSSIQPSVIRQVQKQTVAANDGAVWKVGDKVMHKKWNVGTVVKVTGEGTNQEIDVAFAGMGIKRLLASFAPIERIEES